MARLALLPAGRVQAGESFRAFLFDQTTGGGEGGEGSDLGVRDVSFHNE